MVTMKKIASVLILAVLVFSLAACGSTGGVNTSAGENESQPVPEDTSISETDQAASDSEQQTDSNGKTIVVYFSASGNTKRVAELAADELGADLFELVPAEPYSDADLDWTDSSSRVNREHEDVSLQDIELVSTEVQNWSEYDTVLFGYPLWWREAPWVVNHFIQENDFTGKTVIPFCTSTSNGLGDSGIHLAEMAGSGNWIEGVRFSEQDDEDSIREWVSGLDLE